MKSPATSRSAIAAAIAPVLAFCACAVSCISDWRIVSADVPPRGWSEPVVLRYVNADTVTLSRLTLSLYCAAGASPRENICLVEASTPSGAPECDTLRIGLPGPAALRGNNMHQIDIPFRSRVRFAETGEYSFTVTPLAEVRGVWSVSLSIDKLK